MTTFTYFEPLLDGHCTFWARIFLRAAAHDPRIGKLRLATSPPLVSRLGDCVTELGVEIDLIPTHTLARMTGGPRFLRGRAQWSAARRFAQDGPVFLPFFDYAAVAAAADPFPLPQGQRVSGVIFRPPNTYGMAVTARMRADAFRRWATYSFARRVTRGPLFTLDEGAAASPIAQQTGALSFLPDPAPDMALLSLAKPRARDDGRDVVLVFGALTRRKGIFQTFAAWQHLSPNDRASRVLRFVGRLGDEERPAFLAHLASARTQMPEARIELDDRFITDADLAAEVLSAALVLAPYQNHVGSSGVMHWTVAANKPLVVQNTGLIGYQVDRYGLGMTVDCTDPKLLADAIVTQAKPLGLAAPDFRNSHNPIKFIKKIIDDMV